MAASRSALCAVWAPSRFIKADQHAPAQFRSTLALAAAFRFFNECGHLAVSLLMDRTSEHSSSKYGRQFLWSELLRQWYEAAVHCEVTTPQLLSSRELEGEWIALCLQ